MIGLLLTVLLAAEPSAGPELDRFLPCTPGLSITYRALDPAGQQTAVVVERVRGAGREPRSCVLERQTRWTGGKTQKDALAHEYLKDRIVNAGPEELPTAFRPPLLVLPLLEGKKWRFDNLSYQVLHVDQRVELPAGKLLGCITISARSTDGRFRAEATYAPGVGLVRYADQDASMEATQIIRPRAR